MVQSLSKRLIFEEYLTYDDGTDTRYELVGGLLIPMPQPTGQHGAIAEFLNDQFRACIIQMRLPYVSKQGLIAVELPQLEGKDTARIPDVCIISTDQWEQLRTRSAAIALTEKPPALVVEIVSTNWRDDYHKKFADYEERGVQEYWIVDYLALGGTRFIGSPKQPTLSVCTLVDDEYQSSQFRGVDRVVSKTFPDLTLTAEQIFAG